MRTLVVGDVHGCSEELDRLVGLARPDRVVLVGDLFTKGPDPAGVWRRIRDGGFEAVLGNHDQRLLEVIRGERAGDAQGRACVRALDAFDRSWRAWVKALPLTLRIGGFVVVHAALHPVRGVRGTGRKIATLVRTWPEPDPVFPHWYDLYHHPDGVIFGHDAIAGLVRRNRDGRPWVIGLDTGCVYGGALSGYLVEEDAVYQVRAARPYAPVSSGPAPRT